MKVSSFHLDRTLPAVGVPPGGLAERRRMVRWPVVRPTMGYLLSLDLPVLLQDISAGGFLAVATINLRHGAAYDFRFAIQSQTAVVRARLAHAMPISGDPESGYLLGFEFVDTQRDAAAIEALIAEAVGAA